MTFKKPCGCTTLSKLDPRHTIHVDSSNLPVLDEKKLAVAFGSLQEARRKHHEAFVGADAAKLESIRSLYKGAAKEFYEAGDINGAVIADAYDNWIDEDLQRLATWEPWELKRMFGE